ncbi:MAG: hypothetical protein R3349_12400, partial [Geminicoccaceae bacterium]|nr:hypothetical protein [Geminicoccaceae bacterium]
MTGSELSDRLVVATGGAGGIARALSPLLLEAGARLHLIDLDEAALDRAMAALPEGAPVTGSVSALDSPAACAA